MVGMAYLALLHHCDVNVFVASVKKQAQNVGSIKAVVANRKQQ